MTVIITPEPRTRVRGSFLTVFDRRVGYYVRAWPRPRSGRGSQKQLDAQAAFKQVVAWVQSSIADDVNNAKEATKGSRWMWRDYLASCCYGTQIVCRFSDGSIWVGRRTMEFDLQAGLDLIGSSPGMVLYRTGSQWGALPVGAAGQVLTADPDTALLKWADLPSPTPPDIQALLDSISDAVGAVLVRGPDGWVEVDPGDLGTVLTMTGSPALPAFLPPSSEGSLASFHPGFVAGRYYFPVTISSSLTARSVTAQRLYAQPFYVPANTTFAKMGFNITTNQAGHYVELGIYADNNGLPSAREYDLGQVSTATTGEKSISASIALTAGWHWLVFAADSGSNIAITGRNTSSEVSTMLRGGSSATALEAAGGVYAAWTYSTGNLPSSFPTPISSDSQSWALFLMV